MLLTRLCFGAGRDMHVCLSPQQPGLPGWWPAWFDMAATVLVCKLEELIFKEAVHEDDEFAHARRQRDQRFFTCGSQTLVKGFEDAVMPLCGCKNPHHPTD
jgi:hypothetical protein